VEVLANGTYQLGVHIADVSILFRWTRQWTLKRIRGTSVYFPTAFCRCCRKSFESSLLSESRVDRLALSVIMHLSRAAKCSTTRFTRASSIRRTDDYEDVQRPAGWNLALERRYEHVLPHMRNIARLAQIVQKRRNQRGAIDFDLPEPLLTYDESGLVSELQNRSGCFRIASSRVQYPCQRGCGGPPGRERYSGIYRVHEEPDPMKSRSSPRSSRLRLKFEAAHAEPVEFQKFVASMKGALRSGCCPIDAPIVQAGEVSEETSDTSVCLRIRIPISHLPSADIRIWSSIDLKAAMARRSQPALSVAQLEAIAT